MKQLIKIPDYYKNLPRESQFYFVNLSLQNGGKVTITLEINWQKLTSKVLHELLNKLAKDEEYIIAIENITDIPTLLHVLTVSAAIHAYEQLLALNESCLYLPNDDFFTDEPWGSTHSFTLIGAQLLTTVVNAEWYTTTPPVF